MPTGVLPVDARQLKQHVDSTWDSTIIPTLSEYIKIPNKSPLFDPDWEQHGYMDQAAELASTWCEAQDIPGMTLEIVRLPGRTPLLFAEIPGQIDDTVMLYGHLDKQPEFSGWEEDLHPWKPVIRDGKLYGRGGADDGYAVFGSLTAIKALQEQGIPHARCVVIIEFCEESGSFDLPFYMDALEDRIGKPTLVVCLDAECGNYDQLWCTTTLRGNVVGTLNVDVLTEGVHSGAASGIVPSSFRVVRELLDRIEDATNGNTRLAELECEIPLQRQQQARAAAEVLGETVVAKFPWAPGMLPVTDDVYQLLLNNTWGASLSVTGASGIPEMGNAGNVQRPGTALKLSFRIPPTNDAKTAAAAIKHALETTPPYNARVNFEIQSAMDGWSAPELAPWLEASMHQASEDFFGAPAMYLGTGGSIPFMGMLGEKFPGVQFLVTGVLGPKSNAHGPNEFLHLATGKAVTACVSRVLMDHAQRDRKAEAA
ncbi:MAG: M20/M25/M40 family metallo-hydrolase [Gammaproteobacteria bacterium]|nr:M20/M25/M40 family metallo-hydrolase [Gammaproteobacteria bacterium]